MLVGLILTHKDLNMNTSLKSVHPVRTRLHPEFIGPVHPREVLQHVLTNQTVQQKYPAPHSFKLFVHPAVVALLLLIILGVAFIAGGSH
jgi:hypothetical protein